MSKLDFKMDDDDLVNSHREKIPTSSKSIINVLPHQRSTSFLSIQSTEQATISSNFDSNTKIPPTHRTTLNMNSATINMPPSSQSAATNQFGLYSINTVIDDTGFLRLAPRDTPPTEFSSSNVTKSNIDSTTSTGFSTPISYIYDEIDDQINGLPPSTSQSNDTIAFSIPRDQTLSIHETTSSLPTTTSSTTTASTTSTFSAAHQLPPESSLFFKIPPIASELPTYDVQSSDSLEFPFVPTTIHDTSNRDQNKATSSHLFDPVNAPDELIHSSLHSLSGFEQVKFNPQAPNSTFYDRNDDLSQSSTTDYDDTGDEDLSLDKYYNALDNKNTNRLGPIGESISITTSRTLQENKKLTDNGRIKGGMVHTWDLYSPSSAIDSPPTASTRSASSASSTSLHLLDSSASKFSSTISDGNVTDIDSSDTAPNAASIMNINTNQQTQKQHQQQQLQHLFKPHQNIQNGDKTDTKMEKIVKIVTEIGQTHQMNLAQSQEQLDHIHTTTPMSDEILPGFTNRFHSSSFITPSSTNKYTSTTHTVSPTSIDCNTTTAAVKIPLNNLSTTRTERKVARLKAKLANPSSKTPTLRSGILGLITETTDEGHYEDSDDENSDINDRNDENIQNNHQMTDVKALNQPHDQNDNTMDGNVTKNAINNPNISTTINYDTNGTNIDNTNNIHHSYNGAHDHNEIKHSLNAIEKMVQNTDTPHNQDQDIHQHPSSFPSLFSNAYRPPIAPIMSHISPEIYYQLHTAILHYNVDTVKHFLYEFAGTYCLNQPFPLALYRNPLFYHAKQPQQQADEIIDMKTTQINLMHIEHSCHNDQSLIMNHPSAPSEKLTSTFTTTNNPYHYLHYLPITSAQLTPLYTVLSLHPKTDLEIRKQKEIITLLIQYGATLTLYTCHSLYNKSYNHDLRSYHPLRHSNYGTILSPLASLLEMHNFTLFFYLIKTFSIQISAFPLSKLLFSSLPTSSMNTSMFHTASTENVESTTPPQPSLFHILIEQFLRLYCSEGLYSMKTKQSLALAQIFLYLIPSSPFMMLHHNDTISSNQFSSLHFKNHPNLSTSINTTTEMHDNNNTDTNPIIPNRKKLISPNTTILLRKADVLRPDSSIKISPLLSETFTTSPSLYQLLFTTLFNHCLKNHLDFTQFMNVNTTIDSHIEEIISFIHTTPIDTAILTRKTTSPPTHNNTYSMLQVDLANDSDDLSSDDDSMDTFPTSSKTTKSSGPTTTDASTSTTIHSKNSSKNIKFHNDHPNNPFSTIAASYTSNALKSEGKTSAHTKKGGKKSLIANKLEITMSDGLPDDFPPNVDDLPPNIANKLELTMSDGLPDELSAYIDTANLPVASSISTSKTTPTRRSKHTHAPPTTRITRSADGGLKSTESTLPSSTHSTPSHTNTTTTTNTKTNTRSNSKANTKTQRKPRQALRFDRSKAYNRLLAQTKLFTSQAPKSTKITRDQHPQSATIPLDEDTSSDSEYTTTNKKSVKIKAATKQSTKPKKPSQRQSNYIWTHDPIPTKPQKPFQPQSNVIWTMSQDDGDDQIREEILGGFIGGKYQSPRRLLQKRKLPKRQVPKTKRKSRYDDAYLVDMRHYDEFQAQILNELTSQKKTKVSKKGKKARSDHPLPPPPPPPSLYLMNKNDTDDNNHVEIVNNHRTANLPDASSISTPTRRSKRTPAPPTTRITRSADVGLKSTESTLPSSTPYTKTNTKTSTNSSTNSKINTKNNTKTNTQPVTISLDEDTSSDSEYTTTNKKSVKTKAAKKQSTNPKKTFQPQSNVIWTMSQDDGDGQIREEILGGFIGGKYQSPRRLLQKRKLPKRQVPKTKRKSRYDDAYIVPIVPKTKRKSRYDDVCIVPQTKRKSRYDDDAYLVDMRHYDEFQSQILNELTSPKTKVSKKGKKLLSDEYLVDMTNSDDDHPLPPPPPLPSFYLMNENDTNDNSYVETADNPHNFVDIYDDDSITDNSDPSLTSNFFDSNFEQNKQHQLRYYSNTRDFLSKFLHQSFTIHQIVRLMSNIDLNFRIHVDNDIFNENINNTNDHRPKPTLSALPHQISSSTGLLSERLNTTSNIYPFYFDISYNDDISTYKHHTTSGSHNSLGTSSFKSMPDNKTAQSSKLTKNQTKGGKGKVALKGKKTTKSDTLDDHSGDVIHALTKSPTTTTTTTPSHTALSKPLPSFPFTSIKMILSTLQVAKPEHPVLYFTHFSTNRLYQPNILRTLLTSSLTYPTDLNYRHSIGSINTERIKKEKIQQNIFFSHYLQNLQHHYIQQQPSLPLSTLSLHPSSPAFATLSQQIMLVLCMLRIHPIPRLIHKSSSFPTYLLDPFLEQRNKFPKDDQQMENIKTTTSHHHHYHDQDTNTISTIQGLSHKQVAPEGGHIIFYPNDHQQDTDIIQINDEKIHQLHGEILPHTFPSYCNDSNTSLSDSFFNIQFSPSCKYQISKQSHFIPWLLLHFPHISVSDFDTIMRIHCGLVNDSFHSTKRQWDEKQKHKQENKHRRNKQHKYLNTTTTTSSLPSSSYFNHTNSSRSNGGEDDDSTDFSNTSDTNSCIHFDTLSDDDNINNDVKDTKFTGNHIFSLMCATFNELYQNTVNSLNTIQPSLPKTDNIIHTTTFQRHQQHKVCEQPTLSVGQFNNIIQCFHPTSFPLSGSIFCELISLHRFDLLLHIMKSYQYFILDAYSNHNLAHLTPYNKKDPIAEKENQHNIDNKDEENGESEQNEENWENEDENRQKSENCNPSPLLLGVINTVIYSNTTSHLVSILQSPSLDIAVDRIQHYIKSIYPNHPNYQTILSTIQFIKAHIDSTSNSPLPFASPSNYSQKHPFLINLNKLQHDHKISALETITQPIYIPNSIEMNVYALHNPVLLPAHDRTYNNPHIVNNPATAYEDIKYVISADDDEKHLQNASHHHSTSSSQKGSYMTLPPLKNDNNVTTLFQNLDPLATSHLKLSTHTGIGGKSLVCVQNDNDTTSKISIHDPLPSSSPTTSTKPNNNEYCILLGTTTQHPLHQPFWSPQRFAKLLSIQQSTFQQRIKETAPSVPSSSTAPVTTAAIGTSTTTLGQSTRFSKYVYPVHIPNNSITITNDENLNDFNYQGSGANDDDDEDCITKMVDCFVPIEYLFTQAFIHNHLPWILFQQLLTTSIQLRQQQYVSLTTLHQNLQSKDQNRHHQHHQHHHVKDHNNSTHSAENMTNLHLSPISMKNTTLSSTMKTPKPMHASISHTMNDNISQDTNTLTSIQNNNLILPSQSSALQKEIGLMESMISPPSISTLFQGQPSLQKYQSPNIENVRLTPLSSMTPRSFYANNIGISPALQAAGISHPSFQNNDIGLTAPLSLLSQHHHFQNKNNPMNEFNLHVATSHHQLPTIAAAAVNAVLGSTTNTLLNSLQQHVQQLSQSQSHPALQFNPVQPLTSTTAYELLQQANIDPKQNLPATQKRPHFFLSSPGSANNISTMTKKPSNIYNYDDDDEKDGNNRSFNTSHRMMLNTSEDINAPTEINYYSSSTITQPAHVQQNIHETDLSNRSIDLNDAKTMSNDDIIAQNIPSAEKTKLTHTNQQPPMQQLTSVPLASLNPLQSVKHIRNVNISNNNPDLSFLLNHSLLYSSTAHHYYPMQSVLQLLLFSQCRSKSYQMSLLLKLHELYKQIQTRQIKTILFFSCIEYFEHLLNKLTSLVKIYCPKSYFTAHNLQHKGNMGDDLTDNQISASSPLSQVFSSPPTSSSSSSSSQSLAHTPKINNEIINDERYSNICDRKTKKMIIQRGLELYNIQLLSQHIVIIHPTTTSSAQSSPTSTVQNISSSIKESAFQPTASSFKYFTTSIHTLPFSIFPSPAISNALCDQQTTKEYHSFLHHDVSRHFSSVFSTILDMNPQFILFLDKYHQIYSQICHMVTNTQTDDNDDYQNEVFDASFELINNFDISTIQCPFIEPQQQSNSTTLPTFISTPDNYITSQTNKTTTSLDNTYNMPVDDSTTHTPFTTTLDANHNSKSNHWTSVSPLFTLYTQYTYLLSRYSTTQNFIDNRTTLIKAMTLLSLFSHLTSASFSNHNDFKVLDACVDGTNMMNGFQMDGQKRCFNASHISSSSTPFLNVTPQPQYSKELLQLDEFLLDNSHSTTSSPLSSSIPATLSHNSTPLQSINSIIPLPFQHQNLHSVIPYDPDNRLYIPFNSPHFIPSLSSFFTTLLSTLEDANISL